MGQFLTLSHPQSDYERVPGGLWWIILCGPETPLKPHILILSWKKLEGNRNNWLKLILKSYQNLYALGSLKAKFPFTTINGIYSAYKFEVRNHSWKNTCFLMWLQKNRECSAQETLSWIHELWSNVTHTHYFCLKGDQKGHTPWSQCHVVTRTSVSTSQKEGRGLKFAETYKKILTHW